MPVPSGLASLSQTALSNSPAGSDTVFPSLDDYLREIFADLARLRDGAHRTLTSVSGTDTITASCAQISTFSAGQVFAFVSAGANTTTTVTLNINGSGAKNVLRAGGAAMAVGDIPASGLVFVGYNGTNFEHLNTKHAVTADSATTATTATSATTAGSVSGTVAIANGGTGQTTAAAAFTALKQDASTSATGVIELATDAEVQTGTDSVRAVSPSSLHAGKMISNAVVATTSGTAFDFTGIPSWARRITMLFNNVSTNGTANLLVQIGSGSIATSGYSSAGDNGAAAFNTTAGFGIQTATAAYTISGRLSVYLMGGNVYASDHIMGRTDSPLASRGGGSVSLSGVMDRIRLTSVGGTDIFDSGSISIIWE